MAEKENYDDYVPELTLVKDPRTGEMKEVDLSTASLSKTMENIRKCADIINNKDTSFDMAMNRFEYLQELILDHAQFSPKLLKIQIKIMDKIVEPVKDFDGLIAARDAFARKYYFSKANDIIEKCEKFTKYRRKNELERAADVIRKALSYDLKEDSQTKEFLAKLEKEINLIV